MRRLAPWLPASRVQSCAGRTDALRFDRRTAPAARRAHPSRLAAHQHRHGRLEHQLIPSAVSDRARACGEGAHSGRGEGGVAAAAGGAAPRARTAPIGARCRWFQNLRPLPHPCSGAPRPSEAAPALTLGSAACTRTAARRWVARRRRGVGATKALRTDTRAARAGCAGRTEGRARLAATAAILKAKLVGRRVPGGAQWGGRQAASRDWPCASPRGRGGRGGACRRSRGPNCALQQPRCGSAARPRPRPPPPKALAAPALPPAPARA